MSRVDPYLINAAMEAKEFKGAEALGFRLHGCASFSPAREEHLAFEIIDCACQNVPAQPPIYLNIGDSISLALEILRRATRPFLGGKRQC